MSECKSMDHTYAIGDQVFDLLSQQMVTIAKITLVTEGHDYKEEEFQSMNFSTYRNGDDDYFVIKVDGPAVEDDLLVTGEFCLLEEAERYRGFDFIPSLEAETLVKAHGDVEAFDRKRAAGEITRNI
jgi:hypothetical protein